MEVNKEGPIQGSSSKRVSMTGEVFIMNDEIHDDDDDDGYLYSDDNNDDYAEDEDSEEEFGQFKFVPMVKGK